MPKDPSNRSALNPVAAYLRKSGFAALDIGAKLAVTPEVAWSDRENSTVYSDVSALRQLARTEADLVLDCMVIHPERVGDLLMSREVVHRRELWLGTQRVIDRELALSPGEMLDLFCIDIQGHIAAVLDPSCSLVKAYLLSRVRGNRASLAAGVLNIGAPR